MADGLTGTSSPEVSASQVTQLLLAWSNGSEAAFERLMPLVYGELHQMAKRYMGLQSPGHTLQTTALIHEAYVRMAGGEQRWENRAHFFGVAARAMRHVLVDYARAKRSAKRGGVHRPIPLEEGMAVAEERLEQMVTLDAALSALEKVDARQCRVVEMRFFGGLTAEESAEILHISVDTVLRDWRAAKAWLYSEMSGGAPT